MVVTHSRFVIASVLEMLVIQNIGDRATLDPWYTQSPPGVAATIRWRLDCFNDMAHLLRSDLRSGGIRP